MKALNKKAAAKKLGVKDEKAALKHICKKYGYKPDHVITRHKKDRWVFQDVGAPVKPINAEVETKAPEVPADGKTAKQKVNEIARELRDNTGMPWHEALKSASEIFNAKKVA
jgi:3-deoxy-D-manno-octulosonate 8-phosphate phosphatase KdsC-like HAD superfamily phosphatase